MRKSTLALLIVVQVLALFTLENMRSLFTTLERNETAALTARAELQAELYVLRARLGEPDPGRDGFFDRVLRLSSTGSGSTIAGAGKEQRLEIRRQLQAGSGLLFQKALRSPQLDSLAAMKKLLSGLVLTLGIFIALSGVYLMVLLRRRQPEGKMGAGSPFQDYLVEMKSAQQELQELVAAQSRTSSQQEELSRGIINTVHLGLVFLAGGNKIEIFNPAAQELFGRSLASVKNQPLEKALPGHPELTRFILAGGPRRSAEVESGGGLYFVDVVPVGAGKNGPVGDDGTLVLVRDVSAERQRERIQRQNENLIMLGEMTASLAHEVRNSLGVILGYSKALKSEPEKTRRIVSEIQFLSDMMEGFLRFARPVEKVASEAVDLRRLVADAAAAQELAVDLPSAPMKVMSDPLLLSVVFANLVLNARQAGAKRLRAEFSAGETPAFTLADDGPGVPAAAAERIWLPFFTSRDKGTGMGLATVKKLVHALNADIQLVNPGEPGAQFKITFYP
ncbi:MAG: hypothetical protein JXO51_07570 [Candidatus Aminicenantes bacterium]|nr:hypothetical protein [Candidatus Aminicenantes bacterium]